ncbi:MAG TPA: homogentisate 1,2-dioxygenase [Edaphocola sp.]|nr:homogentisate 1,2-dioxygenase [Edaphocola sp.]
MAHYIKRGNIPPKRHTQFRKEDGSLYAEQLFSTEGFSSNFSLLYHHNLPTVIIKTEEPYDVAPKAATKNLLKQRSFEGFNVIPEDDYMESRKVVMFNNDVHMALAAPKNGLTGNVFFKNADADEIIFVHVGEGVLKTMYGNISFGYGDYLVIPRGCIYQIEFKSEENRLLIIDSFSPVAFPKRYMSRYGQLLESAPFSERDIRTPEFVAPIVEKGEFLINTKKKGMMYPIWYGYHPFDVEGWDGCEYPYAMSIHDFEPITGRVHLPPPTHQHFEGHNFVVCSFCPRLYDYHPLSIPAPYHHSNIDSDELLYYVDGQFMSRKNVTKGMITLHPAGIVHGPQPGMTEKSVGQKETEELAVMLDTFQPLQLTEEALRIENKDYDLSWND